MELYERKLKSTIVYDGVIVRVKLDTAELPNGKHASREVVEHPGGVAVLPVDSDGRVTLVRQFRYPFQKVLLEAPAGKLERGEDHRLCGARELEEETGMTADELVYLGVLYLSPGYSDEVLHLYLARGLHQGACHPDEDEFLALERMPFARLLELVMADEIHDAKTVAVALKAKAYLGL